MSITPNQQLRKSSTAPSADPPVVKPGRRSKGAIEAGVQQILDGAAPYAAALLRDHIRKVRGVKALKPSIQRACEYVIDHAIGKSRQKIEHTGGAMTYKQLMDSAGEVEKKGRDILADVEDIANKHPVLPPENDVKL